MSFDCFDYNLVPIDNLPNWQQQRSFLYGDGHFTTIKVVHHSPQFVDMHLDRLKTANERLYIASLNWPALEAVISEKADEIVSGYLRVHISRGAGGRGYGGVSKLTPFVFISSGTWNENAMLAPFELDVARFSLSHNVNLAGLKHNNRLEQVLIAAELEQAGRTDALVTDIEGNVIETSKANLFWSDGDNWFTPSLERCGVAGVIRSLILANNPKVRVGNFQLENVLAECRSMLVCNSLMLVRPVAMLAGNEQDVHRINELNLDFI